MSEMSNLHAEATRLGIDTTAPDAIAQTQMAQTLEVVALLHKADAALDEYRMAVAFLPGNPFRNAHDDLSLLDYLESEALNDSADNVMALLILANETPTLGDSTEAWDGFTQEVDESLAKIDRARQTDDEVIVHGIPMDPSEADALDREATSAWLNVAPIVV